MESYSVLDVKIGDKLRLTVREPKGGKDARANAQNYIPTDYVGEVAKASRKRKASKIKVRWHLPASWGYNTEKGTVSTLIHVANGVWLETEKRSKNVVATIERIEEEEYLKLVREAAGK